MKKIYLFCSAGMSTSMLANNMQKVANDHKLPLEIKAFPDGKIDEVVEEKHPDVILLGPQESIDIRKFQNVMKIVGFQLK